MVLREKHMFRAIRRAWRAFWCNHKMGQKVWSDGEGWNIKVCRLCGRAVIFTDDNLTHSPHVTELP